MTVFVISYSLLFCHVYSLNLLGEACSFLMRQKEVDLEERWGGTGMSTEKGNYNQDILNEKIIYFQ